MFTRNAILEAGFAGLLPAVRAAYLEPFGAYKGKRSSAGRAERSLLRGVTVLQTALTLALRVADALLIRTVQNLAGVRPGYDTENILAMTVTSVRRDHRKEFHKQALERIAALARGQTRGFCSGAPIDWK